MSESKAKASRKKNIGFKPKGVDPTHDAVYAVLDALPRGGVSDFIVLAVTAFLRNNAGNTIPGTRGRKYIILGEGDSSKPTVEQEQKKSRVGALKQNMPPVCLGQKLEERAPHEMDNTDNTVESPLPEKSSVPPVTEDSYTDLDDSTLSLLVLNFPSGDN